MHVQMAHELRHSFQLYFSRLVYGVHVNFGIHEKLKF